MFLKDKYGKKWKLQAAKVLRTGALCVALAGVGTGVMGTLGELGADLGRLGLITAYADEFADRPEEVEGSSQIQVGNADGSDAEKEDTKGSDTAQWMGQVETDETKLQDNQLEYSELYTLISRYNLLKGMAIWKIMLTTARKKQFTKLHPACIKKCMTA